MARRGCTPSGSGSARRIRPSSGRDWAYFHAPRRFSGRVTNRADGHVSRREERGRDSAGGNAPMGMCPVGKRAGAIRRGRETRRWACVPSGRASGRDSAGGNRADGHASRREERGRDSAGGNAPMGMCPVGKRAGAIRREANRFGIGQVCADGHVSHREERAVAIRRGKRADGHAFRREASRLISARPGGSPARRG